MSVEDREQLARDAGWIPESEWDSSKPAPVKGFKSADEFLNDAPMMLLSATKANKKLQSKLEKIEKRLEQTVTDSRAVNALVQQSYEREKREKDRLKRELERDRQVAIDEGNSEAAIALDRELSQLDTQPAPNAIDPAAQAALDGWVQANPWYNKESPGFDPELAAAADQIGRRINQQGLIPPGVGRLAAVEAEIRRLFPDRFSSGPILGGSPGNPEGGRASTAKTSGRTFDDLPNEAQEAYHRFKKLNPKLTKPQYLSNYEWE